jgi:hypothetical protein
MYYQRNIRDYGDNVHEYNQNFINYMRLLSYHATSATPNRRPVRDSNRNTINSVLNNYLFEYDQYYIPRTTFRRNIIDQHRHLDDVIVRPNSVQISNATEHIEYTNDLPHNACPITLEAFQQGEQVCRIIHCGHIFKESGIREWFRRNVRCPVCRYDIRDFVRPTIREEEQPQENGEENSQENENSEFDEVIRELNEELTNEINNNRTQTTQPTQPSTTTYTSANPLTSLLTTAIRSFINNELRNVPANTSVNELIYTFDIPIDISGGIYRI